MRILLVSIIFLALISYSAAVKCYFGVESEGDWWIKRYENDCGDRSNYCAKGGIAAGNSTINCYSCGAEVGCAEEGCQKVVIDQGDLGHLCCCRGDLCNPAAGPKSFIVSIVVAIAASIGRV